MVYRNSPLYYKTSALTPDGGLINGVGALSKRNECRWTGLVTPTVSHPKGLILIDQKTFAVDATDSSAIFY